MLHRMLLVACILTGVFFWFVLVPEDSGGEHKPSALLTPTAPDTSVTGMPGPAPQLRSLDDQVARSDQAPPAERVDAGYEQDVFNMFSLWLERYANSSGEARQTMLEEGVTLAKKRRPLLHDQLRDEPEQALAHALSYAQYALLPVEIRRYTEEPFTQPADVVVLPNERRGEGWGEETRLIYISGQGQQPLELYVYGERLNHTSKRGIAVQGVRLDQRVAIYDMPLQRVSGADAEWAQRSLTSVTGEVKDLLTGEVIVGDPVLAVAGGRHFAFSSETNLDLLNGRLTELERLAGPDSGSQILLQTGDQSAEGSLDSQIQEAQLLASNWTERPKKAFFIRVGFADSATPATTQAALYNQLNGNVASRLREYSYGKTWVIADVSQAFVLLPKSSGAYASGSYESDLALHDDAIAAYESLPGSVDLSQYDVIGISFPSVGFDYAGMASVGGWRQWLQGKPSDSTIIHEFGHNYGVSHASFWNAGSGSVTGAGTSEEYGDIFDVMGDDESTRGHFHMQAKSHLNWLEVSQWKEIQSSGLYRIYRFDHESASELQGLRIPLGGGGYYWLGYRAGYGNRWLDDGVYLLWQRAGRTKSWLLDTTPGSEAGKEDAAIRLGRTYEDANAGIYITPVRSGGRGAGAWIEVQINIGSYGANRLPSVSIDAPLSVDARAAYQLSAQASDPDGDTLYYNWDFGDGRIYSSRSDITHIWAAGGRKTVRLTVSDGKGGVSQTSLSLNVSDPATSWTNRASGISQDLVAVEAGGGYVLASGRRGTILKSSNGSSWSVHAQGIGYRRFQSGVAGDNLYVSDLVHDGGRWILVGQDYDFDLGAWVAVIMSSIDGVSWSRNYQGAASSELNAVASDGSVRIAVGRNGLMLRSTDGLNWQRTGTLSIASTLTDITYGNGLFVVTAGERLLKSPDQGGRWLDLSMSDGLPAWPYFEFASLLSGKLLLGSWGDGLVTSMDKGASFSSAGVSIDVGAAAYGKGVYFVTGTEGSSTVDLYSYDARNWIRINQQSGVAESYDTVFFQGRFITVGASGAIRQSGFLPSLPDSDGDGIADVRDSTPIFIDTDGDGIDDATERAVGLNPSVKDAGRDLDKDGLSNLAEYRLGTLINKADSDGDGQPDGYDSKPLNSQYLGQAALNLSAGAAWKAFTFPTRFTKPVVIMGPPGFKGQDPGVVRIRSVGTQGMQVRFQEWDYRQRDFNDTTHGNELIPALILEQGRHRMSDGSIWEVGTFDLNGTGRFKWQAFQSAFPGKPQLFLTVQTDNGPAAVSVRAKSMTASGFSAALFEEQAQMDGHGTETVGYLAIHSPAGSGSVYLGGERQAYNLQQLSIGSDWHPAFTTALLVQEEQSKDTELNHPDEAVDALSLVGKVFAQVVSVEGADTIALRQDAQPGWGKLAWGVVEGVTDQWMTVPLNKRYRQAVVVASLGERKGSLGGVQVRNVTADSFQVRFREWDYLDQRHSTGERIFYMVAEAGEYTLSGLEVKAGRKALSEDLPQAALVNYNASFVGRPALFSGLMTSNGSQLAVPRIVDSNGGGFQVGLQEQQSLSDGHGRELLAWIAITSGKSKLNGRRLEVRRQSADSVGSEMSFNHVYRRRFPVLVQSLASFNGSETAIAEQRLLTAEGVTLMVREEQSGDTELRHGKERVDVFVAE